MCFNSLRIKIERRGRKTPRSKRDGATRRSPGTLTRLHGLFNRNSSHAVFFCFFLIGSMQMLDILVSDYFVKRKGISTLEHLQFAEALGVVRVFVFFVA